jgi:hypothetical protein
MRFGKRREIAFVLCVAAGLGMSLSAPAKADGWRLHSTLPGEVPAYDFNTGGEYFAPPVPFGHYAKDPLGQAAKGVGHVKGSVLGAASHFGGKLHGLGHGAGCGAGCGHGDGGGLGSHSGLGHGAGGAGCGFCSGLGLFKHGSGLGTGLAGHGHGNDGCGAVAAGHGVGHAKSYGPYHPAGVVATSQALPTGQAVVQPSAQGACGQSGCGLGGLHSHLGGLANKLRCKLCGGNGCGPCGGVGIGDPCSGCQGSGHGLKGLCGSCGGCGLLSGLRHGGGCPNCGGAGCKNCLKGLGSKLHGLLTSPMGLLHKQKVEWFVGPGGPVPLTPGYVPYIVTTRSPRDFFAFPPMTPDAR